jgi:hypothetical protein
MYAVLIEVDTTGVDPEQGLKALREQIVPAIKSMPGFQSGTWLPPNPDDKGCRSRSGTPRRTPG